jgi:mono/diheme cytochrome c family protein
VRPRAGTVLVLPFLLLACACGGETAAHHHRYLWAQKCAMCHSLEASQPSPNPRAANLARVRPSVEQVRRAVIDGRAGMPKGLLGGADVDEIAAYVAEVTRR